MHPALLGTATHLKRRFSYERRDLVAMLPMAIVIGVLVIRTAIGETRRPGGATPALDFA